MSDNNINVVTFHALPPALEFQTMCMHVAPDNSEFSFKDLEGDHGYDCAVQENVLPRDNEDGGKKQFTDDDQPHRLLKRKTTGEEMPRDDNDDDHIDVHLNKKLNVETVLFCDILQSMMADLTSLQESMTSSLMDSFDLLEQAVRYCN